MDKEEVLARRDYLFKTLAHKRNERVAIVQEMRTLNKLLDIAKKKKQQCDAEEKQMNDEVIALGDWLRTQNKKG